MKGVLVPSTFPEALTQMLTVHFVSVWAIHSKHQHGEYVLLVRSLWLIWLASKKNREKRKCLSNISYELFPLLNYYWSLLSPPVLLILTEDIFSISFQREWKGESERERQSKSERVRHWREMDTLTGCYWLPPACSPTSSEEGIRNSGVCPWPGVEPERPFSAQGCSNHRAHWPGISILFKVTVMCVCVCVWGDVSGHAPDATQHLLWRLHF